MDSRRLLMFSTLLIAVVGYLTLSQSALASDASVFEIDSRLRARMAKDKAQQAAIRSQLARPGKAGQGGECAANNAGTATRPGAAPGQVFDFAPGTANAAGGPRCN